MDEGRKRVLAIVAGILVARHLKTAEDLNDCHASPQDMKSRGLASPDLGDCCAMTFAVQPTIRKTAPLRNLSYEFPSTSGQGWMRY
jgi:hypothetical protein